MSPRPSPPVVMAPDARRNDGEASRIQVIARAVAILRALENEETGLSLGQIAVKVGLARSTVQRIVAALQAEKMLIAASPAGRVMLGPAILRLAGSVRSEFTTLIRPLLKTLSAQLKETVDLSNIKKDHLVFVDQVIGSHRLRTVSAVGESFPLYCTANGKAYLAMLDDQTVTRLIGSTFKPRTQHTITTIEALLAELHGVRQKGLAFDREEHSTGISAAGIAFLDPIGNAFAISVPVPTHRFERLEQVITARLLEVRETVLSLAAAGG